ncbi:MAG: sulfatase [bacterium]
MGDNAMDLLLVVLEGARVDHLGCYGATAETTPFLDQVARQGVRFTEAFTTAPAALPAHASLLSGLFACVHGATEESGALPVAPVLLPEVLRAAGYRTAAFCPDPAVSPASGCGRGFDSFYTARGGGRLTGRAADYARRASDRVLGRADAGARRTTHALLDWLRADAAPFAVLVTFREAALEQRPPAPYDRLFTSPTADASATRRAWHSGALRYLDLRLQEIADALIAEGRWERTMVVVTGTGGLAFDGAAPMREASLRMPLLWRAPGLLPAGFVVDEIAQLTDIAPTVLGLLGVAAPSAWQGRALLRDGAVTAGPRWAFAESYRRQPGDVRRKAVWGRRGGFVWQSDEANAIVNEPGTAPAPREGAPADVAAIDRMRRVLFDWLADAERWARAQGLEAETAPPPAQRWRGAGE